MITELWDIHISKPLSSSPVSNPSAFCPSPVVPGQGSVFKNWGCWKGRTYFHNLAGGTSLIVITIRINIWYWSLATLSLCLMFSVLFCNCCRGSTGRRITPWTRWLLLLLCHLCHSSSPWHYCQRSSGQSSNLFEMVIIIIKYNPLPLLIVHLSWFGSAWDCQETNSGKTEQGLTCSQRHCQRCEWSWSCGRVWAAPTCVQISKPLLLPFLVSIIIIIIIMAYQHIPTSHFPARWEDVIMMKGGNMTESH